MCFFEEGKSWNWDNQQRSTDSSEIVIEEMLPLPLIHRLMKMI
jgi:hypothetical protein